MLDQLIESKSNGAENKKRGGYLLTTFVLVTGLCFSAFLWSLFAKDFGIGNEGFELSTIVAPPPAAENEPPAPVRKEQKTEQSKNTKSETTRQTNMLRTDEPQLAPIKISVVPNTQKSRPNGHFLVRDGIEGEIPNSSAKNTGRAESSGSIGISDGHQAEAEIVEKTTPPPPPMIKKPMVETVEKRKAPISGGVVNGQATSLPKPPYPLAAKVVRAGGDVNVQVTIDETGRVISAKAIDGHVLLKPAAEKAAWSAKFKPTLLSKQPVKVTGVIVYRFAPQ